MHEKLSMAILGPMWIRRTRTGHRQPKGSGRRIVTPAEQTWWVVTEPAGAASLAPALPWPVDVLVLAFGGHEVAAYGPHGERRAVRVRRGEDAARAEGAVAELLERGDPLPDRLP
jgi:hypothetical protein